MNGYLIDTDWAIDAMHHLSAATRTLASLTGAGLAVSIISYGELFEGAYYAPTRAVALTGLREFLQDKPILSLTDAIMETFAIVRGQLTRPLRQQIGDLDLLIAATALTHDLTLLTRNLRDFQHIPGLTLYQVT